MVPARPGLSPGISAHEHDGVHRDLFVLSGVPRVLGRYAVEDVARTRTTAGVGPARTAPGRAFVATERLVIDVASRQSAWESSSFVVATTRHFLRRSRCRHVSRTCARRM